MAEARIHEMIDVVFDLEGGTIPVAYRSALWAALQRHAPQLATERHVGILPLRSSVNSQGMVLARRVKLAIRVPTSLVEAVTASLSGQEIDLAGSALRIGAAKRRPVVPFPTIHAQLVTGSNDEVRFTEDIREQMKKLGVSGNLICGKRVTINDGQRIIEGFSLVLHDLKPEASLQLQYAGLGEERQFGCGIFVPYKVITGLGED